MGIGRATSVDGEEWQGVMRKVTFTPDGNEAQGLIRPQHCGLTPLFSERYFSHFCVTLILILLFLMSLRFHFFYSSVTLHISYHSLCCGYV